jgi:D-amino peptidase
MAVLLLTDLEGVAGVDDVADLLEGQPGYPRAQGLLAGEIDAALAGLAAGPLAAREVVVSDSHRGGPAPTVDAGRLPPGVTLYRGEDAYDLERFAGLHAVACLGMHAGDRGFTPHTVDLSCVWESRADGRPVTETDLFLGLAAARGLPVVFVAGDDALAPPPGVPFVATKTALGPARARSRAPGEVAADLRRAAASAPRPAPALAGELALRFRSRWMADAAAAAGGARLDETVVAVPGATLTERYAEGRRLVAVASAATLEALRPWALGEDAATLASRPFARAAPSSRQAEARRALAAFLARSDRPDDWSRANRALVLHMLEGHAPAFFAAEGLAPVLADAVARLAAVPVDFSPALDHGLAMARLDALYVAHERGAGRAPGPDGAQLAAYVRDLVGRNAVFAWLMGEIAHQIGLPGRLSLRPRPFRRRHRMVDVLWITHLFLLETRYLQRKLSSGPSSGWGCMTEELLLAVPFLLRDGHLDAAGEVALCLVAAGEGRAAERAVVLSALAAHQQPDGSVAEPAHLHPDPESRDRVHTHCTAVALLAFATAA